MYFTVFINNVKVIYLSSSPIIAQATLTMFRWSTHKYKKEHSCRVCHKDILTLGDRWRWSASQHGRSTPGAEDQNRALVAPDSRIGGAGEEENKYLVLPGTEPRFHIRPARSLVTLRSTLSTVN